MRLRARICLAGLGLSAVWAWVGQVPSAEAQGGGREPEAHPLLTENEYRLVAEQSQKSAALRSERKAARLTQLTARLARVRAEANTGPETTGLVKQLSGVVARLEAGSAPLSEDESWSRNHGRRMMLRGLWSRYGKQLYQPAVVAEFDAHAWRVARLERAHRVVQLEEDVARRERLTADVDALVAAESERHRTALERLIQSTSAPPASVSAQPPSVQSPAHSATSGTPSTQLLKASSPSAQSPSAQSSAGGPNP